MDEIKCPWCGGEYYTINHSTATAMYWAPVYKNGVPQDNNDPNYYTDNCRCVSCGQPFTIQRHCGRTTIERVG